MERGMTADQLLAALWRRKGLVGAVAAGVFAVGTAVVISLPSVYTATVTVRVDPQVPQHEVVNQTVSESPADQILTVRQELLSSAVLARVIQEFNLYPELVSKKGTEAAVDAMRRDLDVKIEGTNAYDLTYSAHDAQTAAKVANRLPELYAEENARIRTEQAARAAALFADEAKGLRQSVIDYEKRIAQFKVDHLGELPEQMDNNMHGIDRITTQLNTKSEELRAAENRRAELALAHHTMDTDVGRLEAQEAQIRQQLTDAKSQWTADHPEVQRLTRDLATVDAQRREADGRAVADKLERQHAEQLIVGIQKDMEELRKQADAFQARLDRTPRWAHELAVMNADYEAVKTKYQSVVSRKVEAELASELEARSAKSLFHIVAAASAPSQAAKPDRMSGMAIAFLVALALGVLIAVVLEMRDDSVRDLSEVKARLPIPLLAVVPQMGTKLGEKRVLMPARPGASPRSTTTLN